MTITNEFHIIKAVSPAGENSHFMFMEVINTEIALEPPFTKKSIFRILSYLVRPKIKAINISFFTSLQLSHFLPDQILL